MALEAAADVAARVLLPHLSDLDAVVLGGDRRALAEVLEDPRLRPLQSRWPRTACSTCRTRGSPS